ncbi:UNVERIFIED_CONTAM: hypothetical protein B566_EDAN014216 [Ephemera danica]|nr:hypothetical protein B566_EDAN014216 [Ephemera danica]
MSLYHIFRYWIGSEKMPRYVFATLAESPQTTLSSVVTLPSVGLSDDEEMAAVIVDPFSSSLKPEPEFISSDHAAHIFVDPRISKLCRSCGKEKEDMINIFTDEGETMFLPEKIQDVLSIPVTCIAQLELAHKFRLEYLKAEDHFCKLLQSPVVDEVENNVASALMEMETEEDEAEIPEETTIIISVVNEPDTPIDALTVDSDTSPTITPVTASTPATNSTHVAKTARSSANSE